MMVENRREKYQEVRRRQMFIPARYDCGVHYLALLFSEARVLPYPDHPLQLQLSRCTILDNELIFCLSESYLFYLSFRFRDTMTPNIST